MFEQANDIQFTRELPTVWPSTGWMVSWVAFALALATGCQPLKVNSLQDRLVPSNTRDWSPEFSKLAYSRLQDDQITVHNIRNNTYVTEKDFVVQHYDRTFPVSDIQSVDFIVVPFKMKLIAHTMLSFGLRDGSYIAVSVEIRTEKGEAFSSLLGASRQYELIYVVADERDLIRLRTRHRDAEVYLYPTTATPEQAQAMFLEVMQRVNQLAEAPEFYNTFRNNCTTNLVRHVNRLNKSRIPYSWQVLLPGYSDEYAYELGLLDRSLPFWKLKRRSKINDLADHHFDDPNFSHWIRSRQNEAEVEPSP